MPDSERRMSSPQQRFSLQESTGSTMTLASVTDRNSCAGRIVISSWFENFALTVIILNACWIGFELEWNEPGGLPREVFVVGDNLFCSLFTLELILRMLSYRRIYWFFTIPGQKRWNFLDIFLVVMMVLETWILEYVVDDDTGMSQLSILRLLRLLRLTRIFRYVPELGMMVKSLMEAFRAVASGALLMLMLMYVFAIVLTQWGKSEGIAGYCNDGVCMTEHFGTIGFSMLSLGQVVTYDNVFELIRPVLFKDFFHGSCLIVFMCVGGFMVLNMLLAVICSVISECNYEEKERRLFEKAEEALELKESMLPSKGNSKLKPSLSVVQRLGSIGFNVDHLETICKMYGKSFTDADDWQDIDHREVADLAFKLRRPLQSIDVLDTLQKAEKLHKRMAARQRFTRQQTSELSVGSGFTGENKERKSKAPRQTAISRGSTTLEKYGTVSMEIGENFKKGSSLSKTLTRTRVFEDSTSLADLIDKDAPRSPSASGASVRIEEASTNKRSPLSTSTSKQSTSEGLSDFERCMIRLDKLAADRLDNINALSDRIQALSASMSPSEANIPKRSPRDGNGSMAKSNLAAWRQEPAACSQQPAASSQQLGANSQQPAASSQEPGTSSQQPTASSQQQKELEEDLSKQSEIQGLAEFFRGKLRNIRNTVDAQRLQVEKIGRQYGPDNPAAKDKHPMEREFTKTMPVLETFEHEGDQSPSPGERQARLIELGLGQKYAGMHPDPEMQDLMEKKIAMLMR